MKSARMKHNEQCKMVGKAAIGRRTKKDILRGKQISIKDGFENFSDYFTDSDSNESILPSFDTTLHKENVDVKNPPIQNKVNVSLKPMESFTFINESNWSLPKSDNSKSNKKCMSSNEFCTMSRKSVKDISQNHSETSLDKTRANDLACKVQIQDNSVQEKENQAAQCNKDTVPVEKAVEQKAIQSQMKGKKLLLITREEETLQEMADKCQIEKTDIGSTETESALLPTSVTTLNTNGDTLGSISRSDVPGKVMEEPSSAIHHFKTKKRLTFSEKEGKMKNTANSTSIWQSTSDSSLVVAKSSEFKLPLDIPKIGPHRQAKSQPNTKKSSKPDIEKTNTLSSGESENTCSLVESDSSQQMKIEKKRITRRNSVQSLQQTEIPTVSGDCSNSLLDSNSSKKLPSDRKRKITRRNSTDYMSNMVPPDKDEVEEWLFVKNKNKVTSRQSSHNALTEATSEKSPDKNNMSDNSRNSHRNVIKESDVQVKAGPVAKKNISRKKRRINKENYAKEKAEPMQLRRTRGSSKVNARLSPKINQDINDTTVCSTTSTVENNNCEESFQGVEVGPEDKHEEIVKENIVEVKVSPIIKHKAPKKTRRNAKENDGKEVIEPLKPRTRGSVKVNSNQESATNKNKHSKNDNPIKETTSSKPQETKKKGSKKCLTVVGKMKRNENDIDTAENRRDLPFEDSPNKEGLPQSKRNRSSVGKKANNNTENILQPHEIGMSFNKQEDMKKILRDQNEEDNEEYLNKSPSGQSKVCNKDAVTVDSSRQCEFNIVNNMETNDNKSKTHRKVKTPALTQRKNTLNDVKITNINTNIANKVKEKLLVFEQISESDSESSDYDDVEDDGMKIGESLYRETRHYTYQNENNTGKSKSTDQYSNESSQDSDHHLSQCNIEYEDVGTGTGVCNDEGHQVSDRVADDGNDSSGSEYNDNDPFHDEEYCDDVDNKDDKDDICSHEDEQVGCHSNNSHDPDRVGNESDEADDEEFEVLNKNYKKIYGNHSLVTVSKKVSRSESLRKKGNYSYSVPRDFNEKPHAKNGSKKQKKVARKSLARQSTSGLDSDANVTVMKEKETSQIPNTKVDVFINDMQHSGGKKQTRERSYSLPEMSSLYSTEGSTHESKKRKSKRKSASLQEYAANQCKQTCQKRNSKKSKRHVAEHCVKDLEGINGSNLDCTEPLNAFQVYNPMLHQDVSVVGLLGDEMLPTPPTVTKRKGKVPAFHLPFPIFSSTMLDEDTSVSQKKKSLPSLANFIKDDQFMDDLDSYEVNLEKSLPEVGDNVGAGDDDTKDSPGLHSHSKILSKYEEAIIKQKNMSPKPGPSRQYTPTLQKTSDTFTCNLPSSNKRKSVTFATYVHQYDDVSPKKHISYGTPGPVSMTASPVHFDEVTTSETPKIPERKEVKIIVPSPESSESEGTRKSKRTRVKTLAWYKNERIEYKRRQSGLVIAGVISPVEKKTYPRRKKFKPRVRRRRIPATPRNLSIHEPTIREADVKMEPKRSVLVINPETEEDVYIDCMITQDSFVYRGPYGNDATKEDHLILSKAIQQKAFAAGQIILRPLQEKGLQYVKKDTMVFTIIRGKVAVTIHETTAIMESGDMFFVPQGNIYNIRNVRSDEAKLVFFQHKG